MNKQWNRRDVLAAGAVIGALPVQSLAEATAPMLRRPIPGSDRSLPVIGQGTSRVFDVNSTPSEIADKRRILDVLLEHGGTVVDTSPMYGRSERIIGDVILDGLEREPLFLATKVWTDGKAAGIEQMKRSADLMRTDAIDLMQVHNLRDTDLHMASIKDMKADGRIRFSGLTHYRDAAQDALMAAMRKHKPDFIQINYSIGETQAADRLLPAAADLGVAVLVNRPFQAGQLFQKISGLEIPEWATPFADSWGQFFLKYIVSHPAVTAAIPATSKPHHMLDNLQAGKGEMPDSATRDRMLRFVRDL